MKTPTVICLICAAVNIPFLDGNPMGYVAIIICLGCAIGAACTD